MLSFNSFAQQAKIDSLENLLKTAKQDTTRINTLNSLCREQRFIGESKKAYEYGKQALELAKQSGYKRGMANSYNNIGLIYAAQSDYTKAMEYYLKSLEIMESLGDKRGMAVSYNNIGVIYRDQNNYPKALEYYSKSLEIIESLGDKQRMAVSYNNIGVIYRDQSNYPKALEYYIKSLEIRKSFDYKRGMASSYNNIGEIYRYQSDYPKALEYHLKSLGIMESLFDKQGIARSYNHIGIIYGDQSTYPKALEYFLKGLEIQESIGYKRGMANSYNNIGNIYLIQRNYPKALEYYLKSLEVKKSLGDKRGMARSYNNIGELYTTVSELSADSMPMLFHTEGLSEEQYHRTLLDSARRYQLRALTIKKKLGDKLGMTYSLNGLGDVLSKQGEWQKALRFYEEAAILAEEIRTGKMLYEAYQNLAETWKEIANCKMSRVCKTAATLKLSSAECYKRAYDYENKYAAMKDSIFNEESIKQIAEMQTKYETEKKEKQIEIQSLKLGRQESELKRSKTLQYAFIFGLVLLSALAFLIYNRYRLKKKSEEKIMKQNEALEQSYKNVTVLSEIGQKITSTLDLDKILDTVYKSVNNIMDATEFGIGVYDDKKEVLDLGLYIYESQRLSAEDAIVSMKDKNRLSVWCVENMKEVFINDIQTEYSGYISTLDGYKDEDKLLLNSVICLPLIVEDRVIGLISVQSPEKNAYANYHLEMLRTLASYTAIALDNAGAYKNLNRARNIIEEKNKKLWETALIVNKEKEKVEEIKRLLEKKNTQMTDSINYAKHIQQAILVKEKAIQKHLPEFFIFLKPMHIVSGDFYWFSNQNGKSVIAAVDCTGHGVPGAFMSMIGNTLLNEIVNEKHITDPAEILKQLHIGVLTALHQTEKDSVAQDGMDIAIAVIDKRKMEIQFAGAKNPLYVVHNHSLEITNADIYSIGGISIIKESDSELNFTKHSISINKNTTLYIFSDGYMDQFGGKDRKKFGSVRFKQLLLDNAELDMEQQKSVLSKTMEEWQSSHKQIDDMLVIGVRI